MQEVLGVKGDGCGWHWNIFIQCATIANVGPYSKCHRFTLKDGNTSSVRIRKVYLKWLKTSYSNGVEDFLLIWGKIHNKDKLAWTLSQPVYLGSFQLNGSLLFPLLSALSRSLTLAWALALDLSLHLPLLLERDIWVWWSASVWISWSLRKEITEMTETIQTGYIFW